jgi:hypothetical protein
LIILITLGEEYKLDKSISSEFSRLAARRPELIDTCLTCVYSIVTYRIYSWNVWFRSLTYF